MTSVTKAGIGIIALMLEYELKVVAYLALSDDFIWL